MTGASAARGDRQGAEEHGIAVLRGVPYAAPPVGPLRFMAPEPAAAWRGLRDATRHGAIAPQTSSRLRAAMGGFERTQDEDCLTLTICTPRVDHARRPVLVRLPGGAWLTRAGSLDWYNSARLARRRYGRGRRELPARRAGRSAAPGGQHGKSRHARPDSGTARDQRTCRRFGGDAARITLTGQSAGACAIGLMLSVPDVRHLVHRAIMQSGGFGRPPRDAEQAVSRAEICNREPGLDPDAADIAGHLRTVPAQRLVEVQAELARTSVRFGNTDPPFGPTLPQPLPFTGLIDAIAVSADETDALIGATREAGHAFFAPDREVSEPALTGAVGTDTVARHRRRPGATPRDLLADMTTELVIRAPALRLAWRIARRGSSVFAHQFNRAPPH